MKAGVPSLLLLLSLVGRVGAHGHLSQPAVTFKDGVASGNYTAVLAPGIHSAFRGRGWDGSPAANAAAFADVFPNTGFDSLRAMIDSVVMGCGSAEMASQRVDVTLLHKMKWQDDDARVGFSESHHGPCEAWIDDKRVFQSPDCRAECEGYPAEIPIDFSVCRGDCTFSFFWLALQNPEWEAHKQCVAITNSGDQGISRRLSIFTQYVMAGLDSLFGIKKSEEEKSKQFSSMSIGLDGFTSLLGLRK